MGVVGAVVVVVAIAAALVAARYFFGRAMFEPGTVARRIAAEGESLEPLQKAAGEDPWQVAPGIALHHFATGSGEDVVVVHGGPGIAPERPWRGAEHLAGLRLHFYHQRGCGLSSRPITAPPEGSTYRKIVAAEGRLGLAEQIADLERIRRILGREKLVLVGHSFGALIAGLYAAEFPDRVQALVLVAPAPLFEIPVPEGDLFAQIRGRLPAAMQGEFDAYLKEYFDFPALMKLDEARLSAFFGRLSRFYAAAAGMDWKPEGPGRALGGWMQIGVFLSLGRSHDWTAAMKGVTVPVLVVHGEKDLQPRAASERIARLFPAGRLTAVAGAGHFPFDEQPAAFAAAVGKFLAEVTERAPVRAAAAAP